MVTRSSAGRRCAPQSAARAHFCLTRFLLLLFAFGWIAGGCASPGEPSARKPPIPAPVRDLAVSQAGNAVLLTFTIPQTTTGGQQLAGPPTVQIYRGFQPASSTRRPNLSGNKAVPLLTFPSELVPRYATDGEFRYLQHLDSSDFLNHPDSVVFYSVRTRVSDKRLSAKSNLAQLYIYPAPDRIGDLKGQITPSGVALSWTPPEKTPAGPVTNLAGYEIYRGVAATPGGKRASDHSASVENGLPVQGGSPALQPALVKIGNSTSPSFLDTGAEFGQTYIYSVRSSIDYSGVSIESADSNLVTITPRDTFPPAAPKGLLAVYEPESGGIPAHVDLSWAISTARDLAGYRIYRSGKSGVLGERLDNELLLTPVFRDKNVSSGRQYYYVVTAVDRSGNESTPSATVFVKVPAESGP